MPSARGEKEAVREPQSRVSMLNTVGSAVEVDPTIPPRRYYRSGTEMIRMAKVYLEEGNLENAFILYSKYITLFVEKLPKHPEYQNVESSDKARTKQKLMEVFPVAEKLKSKLLEKYTYEYEAWLCEKAKEEEKQKLMLEEKGKKESEDKRSSEKQRRVVNEWGNQNLYDTPQHTFGPGISPTNSLSNLEIEAAYSDISFDNFTDKENEPEPTFAAQPTLSHLKPDNIAATKSLSLPTVDRSTKPRSLLSPAPENQNAYGLRAVIVPQSVMKQFLHLAQPNTDRSVETCGILAGKLSYSKFTVTHLLIPQQTGTADSCTTGSEEDLFSYQDKYDLITLGWIHTHPTQTAFMSSVDLHTHCSYQLMMPEAIAIVCSPKYQETGMFSLTPDFGLDYIANCREKGFHPHPKEPTLYEECTHVQLDENAQIILADLRK